MKKRLTVFVAVVLMISVLVGVLSACNKEDTRGDDWQKFDLSLPDFANGVFETREEALAAGGGWYYTIKENFDYESAEELLYDATENPDSIWSYSPHALRWEPNGEKSKNYDDWKKKNREKANWWCPDMIEVKDGKVLIKAQQHTEDNPHVCSSGVCPSVGRFTSGIETRIIVSNPNDPTAVKGGAENDYMLFSQAFGYYECKVKLPDTAGMWSAFWLQSSYQRKIGNAGSDGTEIDIFESAFKKKNKKGTSLMGNALLWDGYGGSSKVSGATYRVDTDLYDGYHTFALKWTPTHYVFYVDGKPMWASNDGGVARVAEFIRLTCEIDAGDKWGPHGQKIGKFAPKSGEDSTFYIDHVMVLQHTSFEGSIMLDSDFPGSLDGNN